MRTIVVTLSFFFLTGFWGGSKEPSFVKTWGFDQPLTVISSKFSPFRNDKCYPSDVQRCQSAYGEPCKCLVHKRNERKRQVSVTVVSSKDKVVWQSITYASKTRDAKGLPKISTFFGESEPKYIAKSDQKQNGAEMYVATWVLPKDKVAVAMVACHIIPSGDQWIKPTRLRDCGLKVYQAKFQKEVEIPTDQKKNDFTY